MDTDGSFVFVPVEIRDIKAREIIKELLKQRAKLENQLEFAKDMLRYYIPTNDETRQVFDKLDKMK